MKITSMPKQIKIIAIIFLVMTITIALVLLTITLNNQQKPPTSPASVDPLLQNLPKIPEATQGSFPIISNIPKAEFNKLPRNLPILQQQEMAEITEIEAKQLASNAGFSQEPKIIKSKDGKNKYIWIKSGTALTISAISNDITYSKSVEYPIQGNFTNQNDEYLINEAKKFLNSKGFVQESQILTPIKIIYYQSTYPEYQRPESKENSNVALVAFSPTQSNYKIVDMNPLSSFISISFLPNRSVSKAVVKRSTIIESDKTYDLMTYEKFSNSINSASLVYIDEEQLPNTNLYSKNIKSVSVEGLEVAYLATQTNSTIFQPIYILSGKLQFIGEKISRSAILYLPAIDSLLLP